MRCPARFRLPLSVLRTFGYSLLMAPRDFPVLAATVFIPTDKNASETKKAPHFLVVAKRASAGLPKRAQYMQFFVPNTFGKFRLPKSARNVNAGYQIFLCRHQPPPLSNGLDVWACWQCFGPHPFHRGHGPALPGHGPKAYWLAVSRVTAGKGNVRQFFAWQGFAGGHAHLTSLSASTNTPVYAQSSSMA